MITEPSYSKTLIHLGRYKEENLLARTGPNGAVAMSLANGLVGTGFTSQYRLQPRTGF